MQAVINWSEEGTRLRPLTCDKAPALLPLAGGCVGEALIEHLKEHGADDIVIVTGYGAEGIKEYFKDGSALGVKIHYINQINQDGVLKVNSDILQREFLYFSGTCYTDIDITGCMDEHREKDAYASVLTGLGGRVVCSASGKVTRVEEKRLWQGLERQGSGVYILKRDIVRFIPDETNVSLPENILPLLIRAGKNVYAPRVKGTVESLNDFAAYMRTGVAFLEKLRERCSRGICIEEGAEVEKGALLEAPCYVGKNACIHKGAKIGAYSIVGQGAKICSGVSLKRGIVGEGCRIGRDCVLRGCVLGEHAIIGEGVNIYEQAVVGADTRIGDFCSVKSFVRIWPEKTIENNTIVTENVMWGQKKRASLFENGVIEGVVNADITPKFCTVLGECIAAGMDAGDIGVSTDASAAGAMLRDAITAGLRAMGAAVKDFGEQPLPITRRGVSFYMLQGAVCINVYDKDGDEHAEITVIGRDGLDADDILKERMEDYFEKGDFIYPEGKAIKECEYLFEYKLYYLKSLVGYKKKQGGQKILLSCPATWGRRLIVSAMADFGCSVSMYSPPVNDVDVAGDEFSRAVQDGSFDVGFILDSRCESLTVVLPGKIISQDTYEALTSLVVMKKYKNGTLYVPFTATSAVDLLAEKYGWNVVRTKSAAGEIMRQVSGDEQYLSEQFIFRFDAVGAVIKLMEFVIDEQSSVEELAGEIPPLFMKRTVVELPRRRRENVVSAMGKIKGAKPEGGGVKITLDKGWVAVVPDDYKEVYTVVSEGVSTEAAEELCNFCAEKLINQG